MPEPLYNKVVVVDERDEVIGAEYMFDAIEKGLIRRSASVVVFNTSGQVLVQKRSAKVFKPRLLDNSAGGHVDEGESYLQAARRELYEELGLANFELQEIATAFRNGNFYSAIYKVVVPDETVVQFNLEEIESVHWFRVEELEHKMQSEPELFSPTFLETWSKLRTALIESI